MAFDTSLRGPAFTGAPSRRSALAPAFGLVAVLAVLPLLLVYPGSLPVGPFYWDVFVYVDGGNRVLSGQIPAVDFFAPVGPLGYWLYAALAALFPNGQPLLVAQWSMLLVTSPLFLAVLLDVGRRSAGIALALLVPFLVFTLLPINVEEYYPYPGVDGFGIYNRHGVHVLYVLAAALLFVRDARVLTGVVAGAMLVLFLTKITGFFAGGLLCAVALASGRVSLAQALVAALLAVGALALLEATTGATLAYLVDVARLVGMNEGELLPRFAQAASLHFRVFAPAAALTVLLLLAERRAILADLRETVRGPARGGAVRALADRDATWVGATTFAGLFFETQNTGGQAFIFLWPAILRVGLRAPRFSRPMLVAPLALAAATALPTFVQVVHRAARALVGQVNYVRLESAHLGELGAVSQRPELMERSAVVMRSYVDDRAFYQSLADQRVLPSFTLYAEPDFQVNWLRAADEAAGAILAYEAANGVRFETVMSLNFVNPFPAILGREAPLHVAIGADPFRAVPDPDAAVLDAVRATDLVLYPTCPVTPANMRLYELYAPALGAHRRVPLSPCWDALIRPGLGG